MPPRLCSACTGSRRRRRSARHRSHGAERGPADSSINRHVGVVAGRWMAADRGGGVWPGSAKGCDRGGGCARRDRSGALARRFGRVVRAVAGRVAKLMRRSLSVTSLAVARAWPVVRMTRPEAVLWRCERQARPGCRAGRAWRRRAGRAAASVRPGALAAAAARSCAARPAGPGSPASDRPCRPEPSPRCRGSSTAAWRPVRRWRPWLTVWRRTTPRSRSMVRRFWSPRQGPTRPVATPSPALGGGLRPGFRGQRRSRSSGDAPAAQRATPPPLSRRSRSNRTPPVKAVLRR